MLLPKITIATSIRSYYLAPLTNFIKSNCEFGNGGQQARAGGGGGWTEVVVAAAAAAADGSLGRCNV